MKKKDASTLKGKYFQNAQAKPAVSHLHLFWVLAISVPITLLSHGQTCACKN